MSGAPASGKRWHLALPIPFAATPQGPRMRPSPFSSGVLFSDRKLPQESTRAGNDAENPSLALALVGAVGGARQTHESGSIAATDCTLRG